MIEKKAYETSDGKLFKTENGARNHEDKLEGKRQVKRVLSEMNMTKEEVTENLHKISDRFPIIKTLLKHAPDWTKWSTHQIRLVNKDLFVTPENKTLYVMEIKNYGKMTEDILFEETGEQFTDPELHCEEVYTVNRVEEVDKYTKKVFYDYKLTWEQRMLHKIKNKEELTEKEIKELVYSFNEVYVEEGEDRRWSKPMLTVIDLEGKLVAIEWEQGLTENQGNEFYEQPYLVRIETEEKMVKTIVTHVYRE